MARSKAVLVLLVGLLTGGCQLFELQQQLDQAQQEQILIPGHWQGDQEALVALLDSGGTLQAYRDVQANGLFYFSAARADYQLLAFVDHNHNLRHDPDEPYHWLPMARSAPFQLQPSPTQRAALGRLNPLRTQPAGGAAPPAVNLSLEQLPRLHRNYLQVVSLDDPRFSSERISQGAWQPLSFISEVGYGLYLLAPWDDDKEPIFLVHGINSAPSDWRELLDSIDTERFQVLLFHYPSGVPLNNSAYLLSEAIRDVQRRHPVARFHLFAHSMGGLVSRRAIQLLQPGAGDQDLCLFLTLSTPWAGHPSAASGVAHSPVVAPVWRDMAPGSPFLKELFATPLPPHLDHWLLASYGGNSRRLSQPNDGVVPLASELRPAAQDEARHLFLLPDSHTGILASARSKTLIQRALASLPDEGCPTN